MNILKRLMTCVAVVALTQCTTPVTSPAPVQMSLPAELCYVDEVAPAVLVDLKYFGNDNFVGRRIAGYEGRRAILRKDTAAALKRASDILARQGYALLVWDAYRPSIAMKDFRAWSRTADDRMKARFYPNITKQGIYDGKYIGDVSEHSWGIAVDLTLVHLSTGREVDMGGHHDLLDVSSSTRTDLITPEQQENRLILNRAMKQAGFRNYSKEWWHYFLADAHPCYSYSFPVKDDYVSK